MAIFASDFFFIETENSGNLVFLLILPYSLPCCYRCWVAQSSPSLYNPMDCSKPGFSTLDYLQELAQTPVHWVNAIQPSHPLPSPSPPTFFPVVMYRGESWTIKKSWASKNWCFWTMVLVKTLENPLNSKEIQPVHPKGDQSWVFIGRTDAEAETLVR